MVTREYDLQNHCNRYRKFLKIHISPPEDSGYRILSAMLWSHDEGTLLAFPPVADSQNARSDAAAHTNPVQQGGR